MSDGFFRVVLALMSIVHVGLGQLRLTMTSPWSSGIRRRGKSGASGSQVKTAIEVDVCLDGESCKFENSCKHVHFIRHAEGQHQAANKKEKEKEETRAAVKKAYKALPRLEAAAEKRRLENWPVHWSNPESEQLVDSELTDTGRQQCIDARAKVPEVSLVVVSPFRRTLETALLLFQPMQNETVKRKAHQFIVHDLCRERIGEFTCDERKKMSFNKQWLPQGSRIDYEIAFGKDVSWRHWDWTTQEHAPPSSERPGDMPHADHDMVWRPARESEDWIKERSRMFLRWVLTRPEDVIAVVTHSAFMRFTLDLASVPKNAESLAAVVCAKELAPATALTSAVAPAAADPSDPAVVPTPMHGSITWGSLWTYLLTFAMGAVLALSVTRACGKKDARVAASTDADVAVEIS